MNTAMSTCDKYHLLCFSCLLHVGHSIHCILLAQVKAGVDALTIKRKYKELAVALHPDKCKVILIQSRCCMRYEELNSESCSHEMVNFMLG